MPLPEDLITPKQASRIIRAHVSTVYRWIATGQLTGYRRGTSRYLVSRAAVEAQLREVVPLPVLERKSELDARARAAEDRLRELGVDLGEAG